MIQIHKINVKGYINQPFIDKQLDKRFQDVKYGYGVIQFTGTEEEKEQYLNWLVENEGKLGIKLI